MIARCPPHPTLHEARLTMICVQVLRFFGFPTQTGGEDFKRIGGLPWGWTAWVVPRGPPKQVVPCVDITR